MIQFCPGGAYEPLGGMAGLLSLPDELSETGEEKTLIY
jgi:hypothetical protein